MEIREKLLEAAARLYAEAGFRGATTRRIAQEAGVNEITLFRHFGSKAALLGAAIEHAGLDQVPPLPADPVDPEAELIEWAGGMAEELRAQCPLIRTCMAEATEHPELMKREGSAPAQAAQSICDYIERLRAQGRARDDFDARAAAAMLMGALFADAMGRDVMPDMYRNEPEEALREYVRLFLGAIGVREGNQR